MGGDVGAEPDDGEVTEADLTAPAEQHRQPDTHQRVHHDERQQQPVARGGEVRQLRAYQAVHDHTCAHQQPMVGGQGTPPAHVRVTALTRRTEMPDRRAASGLLAAARICLPSTEYRMKAANPATRMGTTTAVSTYMPVRVTPPMRRSEKNGCG